MIALITEYNEIQSIKTYQTEVLPLEQQYVTHLHNEEYDEAKAVLLQVVLNEDLFKTVPNEKRGNYVRLPYS